MGYDIYIGNGKMEMIDDDEDEYTTPHSRMMNGKIRYFRPDVEQTKHPDAPSFVGDEMTGNGNSRHPGYVGWGEFCRSTGLEDLFFNRQTGLMREHPGYVTLQPEHLETIQRARQAFMFRHPNVVPIHKEGDDINNYHLIRLLWLEWWVKWALENCEHAAIQNF